MKQVYNVSEKGQGTQKDLYMMIETNKLRYTTHSDKQLLQSHNEFEQVITEVVLLSPDVKLHNHNTNELTLDLISYKYESTIQEQKSFVYAMLSLVQQIRRTIYYALFKVVYMVEVNGGEKPYEFDEDIILGRNKKPPAQWASGCYIIPD